MRIQRFALLLIALLLAGCNLPQPGGANPTPNLLETEVSRLLTQAPTVTLPGSIPGASATPPVATVDVTTTTPAPATPTPTSQPTATWTVPAQAAAPTLDPNDPKASLGAPTWQDSLNSGRAFYQFESDNTRVRLADGALVLTGVTANGWHGWSLTYSQQPLNFYLEALFTPQSCSGADLYGLMFRATSNAGYFFGLTCDGRYSLHTRDFEAGGNQTLVQTVAHPAIQAGQANRLGVMARGDRLSLYANGSLLTELTDSTYAEKGYFGAFVAAFQTVDFTVRMEEIALWTLP